MLLDFEDAVAGLSDEDEVVQDSRGRVSDTDQEPVVDLVDEYLPQDSDNGEGGKSSDLLSEESD